MAVLGLAGALAGCGWLRSPTATPPPPAPPLPAPRSSIIGLASWYGPGFVGQHTASGEVYRRDDLTAASRNLPLGTRVQVTNLSTGRAVIVRINDRGPYVHGRGIDLSQRAAERIGLNHSGVARVSVTVADALSTPGMERQGAHESLRSAPLPQHPSLHASLPVCVDVAVPLFASDGRQPDRPLVASDGALEPRARLCFLSRGVSGGVVPAILR